MTPRRSQVTVANNGDTAHGANAPAHNGSPVALSPEAILRAERFREIVDYALRRLGDGQRMAMHRELAGLCGVSTSMVTRYRSGMDPYTISAGVMLKLAGAAGLGVGSVYTWIEHGSERAFEEEREQRGLPTAFSELDLARELVAMLERNPTLGLMPPRVVINYALLSEKIEAARAANAAFDRLAAALPHGRDGLAAVASGGDITPAQWDALAILLGDADPDFAARHSTTAS